MSLTTIFTGHTLDLRDIVAVSAPMQQSDHSTVRLYIEIYLRKSNIITHIHFQKNGSIDVKEWDKSLDDLEEKRTGLIWDWQRAIAETAPTYTTTDPAPEYKLTQKAKKGGES